MESFTSPEVQLRASIQPGSGTFVITMHKRSQTNYHHGVLFLFSLVQFHLNTQISLFMRVSLRRSS
jgi:hypothetical protein